MKNAAERFSLGVDIGGTKCAVVLGRGDPDSFAAGNENGGDFIIDKISFPTRSERGWHSVTTELLDAATELTARNSAESGLIGVGVSCGGPLDSTRGVIMCPPNLPDWDNVPITELISQRLGVPAFLQNDANACAVAEWKFGAGRGMENLVFLTFGTGMGAGLILGGRLYSGTNDMAGEVGHIRLEQDGPVGYGKAGSFEGFCSGGGIAGLARTMYERQLSRGEPTSLGADKLSAREVALAADGGDALAIEIYRECGRHLGMGLSVIVDMLNPQAVIIGSIYERSGRLLEQEMRRVLEAEALPQALAACKILPAQLGDSIGDYAALGVLFAGID